MFSAATKPTPRVTISCVIEDVAPLMHFSDVSLVYRGANRAKAPPENPKMTNAF